MFQIGPLAVQSPGLILLAGLWIGLSLAEKFASKKGVPANLLSNLVYTGLIAGIIAGRAAFALRHLNAFVESPLSLVSLNPGLFSLEEAVVFAVLGAWIYGSRHGMQVWRALDALSPLFLVMAVAVGLANLASGNAFGLPTELPWGIQLWGARRHPTQLYEAITAGLWLLLLWPGWRRVQHWQSGNYFLASLALSALTRLLLEPLRAGSLLLLSGLRAYQLGAWLVLIACLVVLGRQYTESHQENAANR
jgi:prolipoprotein diacylglyceryltransferase